MLSMVRKFRRDESGATAIEYGVLGALLGIGILVGFTFFSVELGALFNSNNSAVAEVFSRG